MSAPFPRARRLLPALVGVLVWLVVAVPVAGVVFANSARTTVIASHEALVRPSFDGWASVDLGPFLPSFRYPSPSRVGASIEMGKTSLTSYDALVQRYAFIAAQPESQIRKVGDTIREMALDAALVGALTGLAPIGLWLLLGRRRRRELLDAVRASHHTAAVTAAGTALAATVGVIVVTHPWDGAGSRLSIRSWEPIGAALPEVPIPAEARPLQVDAGLLTEGTKRLVESAMDSYRISSRFYADAAAEAALLAGRLHQPRKSETVAVLVADRHDNIGMDPVARAIADAGHATILLDAGDDTSTGSSWETFSLESLDQAFKGVRKRFFVAGNHDHGNLVTAQAASLGFEALDGHVVEGPDGIRLLGVDDPRSSGLGNWRDETGLSFDEVADRLADTACAADADGQRVSTLLVHDANLGAPALDRGCVDLVAAGHLHVIVGPDPVRGTNGRVGYSFTTGSTGGAAYAIAIGTKPRRDAVVTLLTYRDGRPVGLQWVSLSPLGGFTVGSYESLPRVAGVLAPEVAAAGADPAGHGERTGRGAGDGPGADVQVVGSGR